MFTFLKEIYDGRELLGILIVRNLKIRYKNSALGFFWTLLVPLFLIVIYATFLRILRFATEDPLFLPQLVTGIIVWQFLAMCLNDSLQAVVGNANLVTKTAFPRVILPLAMVLANVVNFLLSSAVLLVYLLVIKVPFGNLAWLLVALPSQVALCLGLSLLISCLNVFFRDTEHILGVVLLSWFFLTPVIYPFSIIPSGLEYLASVNPMTGIVSAYRGALLARNPMSPAMMRLSLVMAWAMLPLGLAVFTKLEKSFADEL